LVPADVVALPVPVIQQQCCQPPNCHRWIAMEQLNSRMMNQQPVLVIQ
jgi:hypothetical protein